MEKKPRTIYRSLFFWLIFLLIFAGIAVTVLLANNRRNLTLLLAWSGIEPVRTMTIPKPGVVRSFKGKRLGSANVALPGQIFAEFDTTWQGALLRDNLVGGERLCGELQKAGLVTQPWQPGPFSKTIFECTSEISLDNPAAGGTPSTFFLIAKGPERGPLTSMRIKFVLSDPKARETLTQFTARAGGRLADATGYRELAEANMDVLSLTPFSLDNFGISYKFSREFSGTAYNLVLSRSVRGKPQMRTAQFFDRKNFFPLPSEYLRPANSEATTP